MPFYAVAIGRTTGIFTSWADCKAQVQGLPWAVFKKFDSVDEARIYLNTTITISFRPLRRSTNNSIDSHKNPHSTSPSFQYKASDRNEEDSYGSDDGEDLSTVLTKMMDDIEKRLRSSEKEINKILKQNTSKSPGQANLIKPPQIRNRTHSHLEYEKDDDGFTIVYTDGAHSFNDKRGTRAGYGVYWGNGHPLNTSAPVTGPATKNSGEIQAATHAIKQAIQNGIKKLAIHTVSQFLIKSVTKYQKNGWEHSGLIFEYGGLQKNRFDLMELYKLQNQVQIKWNYVEARHGMHGNKMADQFAREGVALHKN